MTGGMTTVIQRINEIKSRFAKMRHNIDIDKSGFNKFEESVHGINSENKSKNTSISEIKSMALKSARINKVPPSLVNAVIETESGYKPFAVSKKGAKGLMQLMPSVIKDMGVLNPFDAQENINGGVTFLKRMLEKYNWDYKKALAAYNAGAKAVDDNNGIPPYKETREYVKKVINAYLKNAE